MVEVKEMPYTEKYAKGLDDIKHDEFVPGFIERHLGSETAEYQSMCQSGIRPIPRGRLSGAEIRDRLQELDVDIQLRLQLRQRADGPKKASIGWPTPAWPCSSKRAPAPRSIC